MPQDLIVNSSRTTTRFLHFRRSCLSLLSHLIRSLGRQITAITLPHPFTNFEPILAVTPSQEVSCTNVSPNPAQSTKTFSHKIAYKRAPSLATNEGKPCTPSQRHKQSLLWTPETHPYITDSSFLTTDSPFHAPSEEFSNLLFSLARNSFCCRGIHFFQNNTPRDRPRRT